MSRLNIKDFIRKVILEVIKETPLPQTLPPPTKPTTPNPVQPPSPKKPNPLQPTRPNIKPRPKALSLDVQSFINVRKGLQEAINTTDYPDFIDPEKRSSIEDEIDYVEHIFPDLGPQADRYLEFITSESYKRILDKAAHYLGVSVSELPRTFRNFPTTIQLLLNTAYEVENIESNHRALFEKMSIDLILGLPEYKRLKQLVDSKQILLDVKLAPADLTNALASDEFNTLNPSGLTTAETMNVDIVSGLTGNFEGKLRRAFANYLTQGDAVNKFWSFNVMNDALEKIHPDLPRKYGFLAAISSILYYYDPKQPHTRAFTNQFAAGSEEVIPSYNGVYLIRVRGRNFLLLLHEIVKGFNDYLSMDLASQKDLNDERLEDELKHILAGPALDMKLRELIPYEKSEYIPLIKKLLYQLPIPQIKELLLGGKKASVIMNKLIKTAESYDDLE
jgi:hypothetical protein